jgi:hypothetical protein
MAFAEPEPWAPAAIARLDVRPGDRALACCVSLATARALAAAVTRDGSLVVVGEPRTAHQLANLRLPQLQAFAHPLRGGARFGVFDALLVCANTAPDLSADAWAELARANLRPGGRAVFDLPAPNAVPGFAAAAAAAGWPAERLAALAGPDDGALADALRRAGLRDVQRELASDLLRAPHARAGAPLSAGQTSCAFGTRRAVHRRPGIADILRPCSARRHAGDRLARTRAAPQPGR